MDYTFTDDYGKEVVVPTDPRRIVSASPAITEIMFALGADNLLVGRTEYCNYPTAALSIENIGGITNLNVEKILSLNPDLVICSSMIPEKATSQLAEMGVPVVCILEQNHFDGLFDNIAKVGRLVNKAPCADSLNAQLKNQLKGIENQHQPHATVYYAVGYGKVGNFTAGGNTFINDILTQAGLQNVAADIEGWEISLEALMNSDPDYVVIRREDSAAFCQMVPYTDLRAVKNQHVIGIESGMIDLQVPRNIEAIKYLYNKTK